VVCNQEEYATLREELLSLADRAARTWRWGILAVGALSVLLLTQASELGIVAPNSMDQSTQPATQVATLGPVLIVALLCVSVLAGTALLSVAARTVFRLEDSADRLGSYLAVFHELGTKQAGVPGSSWHVWNRIERALRPKQESMVPSPHAAARFVRATAHGYRGRWTQRDLWVYPLGLLALVIAVMLVAVRSGVTNRGGAPLVALVIVAAGSFLWFVRWLRRRLGEGSTRIGEWTLRWIVLWREAHEDPEFLSTETNAFFARVRECISRKRAQGFGE